MRVTDALSILRRAEAGKATVDELAEADWTLEERITAALARVGLEAGLDMRLSGLSGGQRTRISLASAVFRKPDFLLLDEPANNLAQEGARRSSRCSQLGARMPSSSATTANCSGTWTRSSTSTLFDHVVGRAASTAKV